MSPADWDDPLDDDQIQLEARFRELEQEAEIEQLRASVGPEARSPRAAREHARGAETSDRSREPRTGAPDPLAHMKSALDEQDPEDDSRGIQHPENDARAEQASPSDSRGEQPSPEGALIVLCPSCKAKNRVSMAKVRQLTPLCGRCKEELVVRA